jgi:hypothetical protein
MTTLLMQLGLIFYNNVAHAVRLNIFLTCGKHLHDGIISLSGKIWTHKTSLASPIFFKMSFPNRDYQTLKISLFSPLFIKVLLSNHFIEN